MKSSGIALFAVTSESQEEANSAASKWELEYKTYGDPHHRLAKYLKEKGLLNVVITSPREKYLNGMAQPAGLTTTQKGEVIHSFAIIPGLSNMYGATGRPNPKEVLQLIKAKLCDSTAKVKKPSKYGFFKFEL